MNRAKASHILTKSLWDVLAPLGFKHRNRVSQRTFGDIRQSLELINVARPGSPCPSFRLYAGVFADEFMASVSQDYDKLGTPFPIFYVEASDLGAERLPLPIEVCNEEDALTAHGVFRDQLEHWLVPFLDSCSTMSGILIHLREGRAYLGGEAKSEAFLRIARGEAEKWSWFRHIDENLRAAGLDPADFRYGLRIRHH